MLITFGLVVSKAFQVLSDSSKRAAYDRHGDDPDSRFSGMSSSPSGFGGGRTPGGGMAFESEISPEELFNMFFGGGGGGGNSPFGNGFGGGPSQSF
jgi:DnaJ family protein B protein 12